MTSGKIRLRSITIMRTVLVLLLLFLVPLIEGTEADAADTVGKLIQKLQNLHPKTRAKAAKELGDIKDSRAVAPLINTLKDPDSYVRGQSARSLGKLKDNRAVAPLIVALKDDYAYVREEAARSLGEIKDVSAVGPLINFLKEDSTYVREEAVKSLIKMGPNAVAPLLKAGKEKDLRLVADAYSFFICSGWPDSESLLIDSLRKYGTEKMAEDFAYSGNDKLKAAAYEWADGHKYKIGGLLGAGNSPVWGRCAN